jgi:translocator protein
MTRRSGVALLLCFAIVAAAAAIATFASLDAGDFYDSLRKPGWAPSPAVFAPVWTVLYTIMAYSVWRVWRAADRSEAGVRAARVAFVLFGVQLVLNALWSWLFFRWHLGMWATFDIIALWITLRFTLARFRPIDAPAAFLQLPYLLWVAYAAALCAAVWRMNPGTL